jgi:flagellar biosynthesis anti-sigma factor FlgM
MKIPPGSPQAPLLAETTENKTVQGEAAAKGKAAGKPSPPTDQVDFSTSLTLRVQQQQELQARRVESIKASIKAGTYQVSSLAVAQKMLSISPDF